MFVGMNPPFGVGANVAISEKEILINTPFKIKT